jgi:hypothetical protein
MTFGEIKQICDISTGKLFVKDNEHTDEVFLYDYRADESEVWIIIDDFEGEPTSETAKEICKKISMYSKDTDTVFVLYTDSLADVIRAEIENGNVYLYTE